jgi:hypothetical protein
MISFGRILIYAQNVIRSMPIRSQSFVLVPPPATDHHHHHHQVMSSLILELTELDFVDVGDIFNIIGNLQTFYLHICIASCL